MCLQKKWFRWTYHDTIPFILTSNSLQNFLVLEMRILRLHSMIYVHQFRDLSNTLFYSIPLIHIPSNEIFSFQNKVSTREREREVMDAENIFEYNNNNENMDRLFPAHCSSSRRKIASELQILKRNSSGRKTYCLLTYCSFLDSFS